MQREDHAEIETRAEPESPRGEASLRRQLGLFDTILMLVGIVVGSGIFTTTGIIAGHVGSPGLILLVWVVGGLLTLAGVLTYAELGAAMPHAGGHYVYLREAYGPLAGFLFGWQLFLVAMTGSIAILGVAFAEYLAHFFPGLSGDVVVVTTRLPLPGGGAWSLSAAQIVAVGAILVVSAWNLLALVVGKTVNNVLTVVKIVTLVTFIAAAFALGEGEWFRLLPEGETAAAAGRALSAIGEAAPAPQHGLLIGLGLALIAVSWAFDGWNNVNYIAGEVRDPGRTLPVALISGTVMITCLYVLTNVVYLYALPVHEMSGVVPIAERAAAALFGPTGSALLSAAVALSVLGALNASIIVGPRVYFAMAADQLFFRRLAEIHPRTRTPVNAIAAQAAWACVLTVSGTFEQLYTFVMFVSILFWVAAVAAVFTLRRRRPEMPRPYRTWGYPFTPAVFIAGSVGVLGYTLVGRPIEALVGVSLTAVGIPVYQHWRRQRRAEGSR